MEFLNTTLYFLITIGVLVFVHELGHFLAAIACGMRADVFALGMGNRVLGWNKINGFSFGKLNDDIDLQGNTDFRVAAFPIGGYVKIVGMVDESLDEDLEGSEPQPWEYRAKPIWQRMIVISAGVIMNIILAIGIFWGISYQQGDSLMQTTKIGMVVKESPAASAGFQTGDKILVINNKPIEHWEAIQTTIYFDLIGQDLTVQFNRGGVIQSIFIPRNKIPDISESMFGIIPDYTEAIINDVITGKPAETAGILSGDIIVSINGEKVFNQDQVIRVISANPEKNISLEIKRGDEIKNISVTPAIDGRVGITVSARYTGPIKIIRYGLLESFPRGVNQTLNTTVLFGHSIWQLIVGKADLSKSVGGPVKIAQIATRSAEIGLMSFLAFMALLSISLAVMNMLPLPVLDGGHLILLLYELIVRRPLPHKFQIRYQQVGMAILLSFMFFILYNDIFG